VYQFDDSGRHQNDWQADRGTPAVFCKPNANQMQTKCKPNANQMHLILPTKCQAFWGLMAAFAQHFWRL
jgi:hypothetical protein